MKMFGSGLSLVNVDGKGWDSNKLMFADDMALVAGSKWRPRQFKKFDNVCKGGNNEYNTVNVMNGIMIANDMHVICLNNVF